MYTYLCFFQSEKPSLLVREQLYKGTTGFSSVIAQHLKDLNAMDVIR